MPEPYWQQVITNSGPPFFEPRPVKDLEEFNRLVTNKYGSNGLEHLQNQIRQDSAAGKKIVIQNYFDKMESDRISLQVVPMRARFGGWEWEEAMRKVRQKTPPRPSLWSHCLSVARKCLTALHIAP